MRSQCTAVMAAEHRQSRGWLTPEHHGSARRGTVQQTVGYLVVQCLIERHAHARLFASLGPRRVRIRCSVCVTDLCSAGPSDSSRSILYAQGFDGVEWSVSMRVERFRERNWCVAAWANKE